MAEPVPPKNRIPKRRTAALMLGAGAVVVLAAGIAYWVHASARESTDDAQIEGNIVSVGVRVGGTVAEVLVDDNQAVEAGSVLLRLDPTDFEVAVRKAEAELADARAAAVAARAAVPITTTTATSQVATADAATAAAGKEVRAAEARVAESRANWDRTQQDLERYRPLVAKDEISKQQFDAAVASESASRSAVDAAEASLAAAHSRLAQAEAQARAARTAPHQIEVARARAEAADAQVARYQSMLAQAKLNLEYTTVKAPAAGTITKKGVEPGQVVMAGQPVFALVPAERVWVVANFKESQLRYMRAGQAAEVYVDAYARTYRGRVDSIGGATAAKFSLLPPENATGNFVKVVQRVPVKIVFDEGQDAEHRLRPGMSVVPTVRVK